MNGKVERKIRQVKESIRKKLLGHRLSVLEWETLGDQIANSVNNMPLATINVSADIENLVSIGLFIIDAFDVHHVPVFIVLANNKIVLGNLSIVLYRWDVEYHKR